MKMRYLRTLVVNVRLDGSGRKINLVLVCLPGSAVWGQNWLTGRCSRAPASALVCRLWACGRCCWRKEFSTMVRLSGTPPPAHVCVGRLRVSVLMLSL